MGYFRGPNEKKACLPYVIVSLTRCLVPGPSLTMQVPLQVFWSHSGPQQPFKVPSTHSLLRSLEVRVVTFAQGPDPLLVMLHIVHPAVLPDPLVPVSIPAVPGVDRSPAQY